MEMAGADQGRTSLNSRTVMVESGYPERQRRRQLRNTGNFVRPSYFQAAAAQENRAPPGDLRRAAAELGPSAQPLELSCLGNTDPAPQRRAGR